MPEQDDDIANDLTGMPAVNAVFMRVGVCPDGNSIGIDLIDAVGKTIAHGHLELEQAVTFTSELNDTIQQLIDARRALH